MAVTMNATLTQNSQNIAKNTSSVTLKVTVTTTYGSYNHNGASGTVKFSGNYTGTFNFTATFDLTSTTTIYTKTFTVTHSANGTAKVTAAITFDTDVSSGVLTKTVSKTLTTIPRASTPSFEGSTIGSEITIDTNRKSSSFTHTLSYSIGSASGTIASSVGASTTWTPPMSLCNQITGAASGDCEITCKTYSGSTLIGTKTAKLSLKVPDSVVPTLSGITLADGSGLSSKYGAYVQSLSSIVATATAAGAYGSTIKTYSFALDGQKSSGSSATSSAMQVLESGTRTLTVTVTDTRGRSASKTLQITVAAYTYPTAVVTAFRSTGGTEDDESTTIRVGVNGSTCNVNSKGTNTATVAIAWKLSTSETWTTAQSQNRGLSFNFYVDLTGKANTSRFDIRVTVTDQCGQSIAIEREIGTATPVLDFRTGGKGVAVLGISDRDGFRVNAPVSLNSTLGFEDEDGITHQFLSAQANGRPTVENHMALANGIYLQALLASGAATNILRMNESGQLELNWTSGGMKGRVFKQLWSGTLSPGGKVTISELPYYNLFLVEQSYNSCVLIMNRMKGFDTDAYTAIGGYANASTGVCVYTAQFQSAGSPTTLELTYLTRGYMGGSVYGSINVTRIIGVI